MNNLSMTPQQLQLAFEAARVTIWNWDIRADQVKLHPLSAPPPGAPTVPSERSRRDWLAAVHPDDRPGVEAGIAQSLVSGANFGSSFRVQDLDGAWRWVGVRAGVRADASGNPVEMSGVSVDITDQKNAEL